MEQAGSEAIGEGNGRHGWSRTSDLPLRRRTLYPAELRARILFSVSRDLEWDGYIWRKGREGPNRKKSREVREQGSGASV